MATKVASLRKCQAEAKKEVLPPVGGAKGCSGRWQCCKDTEKRKPWRPKTAPFLPSFSTNFGPLPSSFPRPSLSAQASGWPAASSHP